MEIRQYKDLNEFNQVNMTQYASMQKVREDWHTIPVKGGFAVTMQENMWTRESVYEILLEKAKLANILDETATISDEIIVFNVYGYINSIQFDDDYIFLGEDEIYATIAYEDIIELQTIVQTNYEALELTFSYGQDGRNQFHCELDRREG